MPKHVALGLTMRHMTGSSSLIGILYGFGHLVSHSDVLEHDTARANKQLCTDNIVPEGFLKKIPTTVIWDNNEFREEMRSGEGTTHNTNDLLVQRIRCVDDGTQNQGSHSHGKSWKKSCHGKSWKLKKINKVMETEQSCKKSHGIC